jgi:spore photoproduct lyase
VRTPTPPDSGGRLLDVSRILLEPAVVDHPRGREILARFPDAERIEVASHWRIPELHGDPAQASDWLANKRSVLVLGVKKGLACRPNGRSADFIAPSASNGCAMACAYCYVPRRKGYANPISTFVNIEQICAAITRHAARQGAKPAANQCDPERWVYDLGENADVSVDARISDNVRDLIDVFRGLENAKASFATKHVNRDLLQLDPQGHARIRFSLMPPDDARILDVRADRIAERMDAIDAFVEAGWEVHVNFSPVVVREGWTARWEQLLHELGDRVGERARRQLACEVIMLTHNEALHETNLRWHPRAEELLWRPELQEAKVSQNGQRNVRYARAKKARALAELTRRIRAIAPWCRIRYAF